MVVDYFNFKTQQTNFYVIFMYTKTIEKDLNVCLVSWRQYFGYAFKMHQPTFFIVLFYVHQVKIGFQTVGRLRIFFFIKIIQHNM